MPLVSVIVPCYNHGGFIETALESIKQQSYTNVEVIIVDDGSTDEHTKQVLKTLTAQYRVIFQENQGPSVARNNAIKEAKGKYLFCLDSDNKVRKEYISRAVQILESRPEVGAVYANAHTFGEENELRSQQDFDIKKQLRYNQIDMCAIIRKEAFDGVDGFDEYMSKRGLEDWDFWIKMHEKGWKLIRIPEIMFDYYVTDNSRTAKVANKHVDDLKRYVWQKHVTLLAEQYDELFHLNKNASQKIEFKIGYLVLYPYRLIMSLLGRK